MILLLTGTYEICVDNESSYTQKKVYLWVDYQRQKAWDEAISEDDAIKKFEIKQDLVRVRSGLGISTNWNKLSHYLDLGYRVPHN